MPKPRKWSNLKGVLPEAPVEVTEREQKVRDQVAEMNSDSMRDLEVTMQSLDEEEEFAERESKIRSIQREAIERRMKEELQKVQDVSGSDVWRGEGMTVYPSNRLHPYVVDKVALRKWIEEKGMTALLALPSATLLSIVCEAMNADIAATLSPAARAGLKPGEPGSMQPPPGVGVYITTSVQRKKS